MLGLVRRGCGVSCLGCVLPLLLLLALLLFVAHQILTPPNFRPVVPAPAAAVQLAAAEGLEAALANQQPVALVVLNDDEATTLLNETDASQTGLSNLQVHSLKGEVVVSGETAIVDHTLVVSGPVRLVSAGGSGVTLKFVGLWIGQLGLPTALPQLFSRVLSAHFNLSTVADGHDLTFACAAAHPDRLVVGLLYGVSVSRSTAVAACRRES